MRTITHTSYYSDLNAFLHEISDSDCEAKIILFVYPDLGFWKLKKASNFETLDEGDFDKEMKIKDYQRWLIENFLTTK